MSVAAARRPQAELKFRALSDRTRLRILAMLRPRELCVCHLVGVLGVPQPKVSRHLAYLRRAGLVTARREGQWMHYALAPARGPLHRKLLECLDCCADELPEAARDARRLERVACGPTGACGPGDNCC